MKATLSSLAFIIGLLLLSSCGSSPKNNGATTVKAVPGEELIYARKDNKSGFMNAKGQWVIAPKYEEAYPFTEGIALVKLDKDKFGLIDMNENLVPIPAGYTVSTFAGGLAPVKDAKGKTGFIDRIGKLVVEAKYDQWTLPKEGMHKVELAGKMFFVDSTGKQLPGDGYDDASDFSGGLACVKVGEKYGYIDKTGKQIVPLKYDYAAPFNEGVANVGMNGMFGFIDNAGKEVIPLKFENVGYGFYMGRTWFVKTDGDAKKYGIIDKTGKEIIAPKYDKVEAVVEGADSVVGLRTYIGNKKGWVIGNIVIEPTYDWLEPFHEGLAAAGNNTGNDLLVGYIDTSGNWVIKPQFLGAKDFHSGMAAISNSAKQGRDWGYIDRTGKVVIKPQYYDAGPFHGNFAFVTLGLAREAMIDRTGKELPW